MSYFCVIHTAKMWLSVFLTHSKGLIPHALFIFLAAELRHRLYLLFIKGLQRKKLNI